MRFSDLFDCEELLLYFMHSSLSWIGFRNLHFFSGPIQVSVMYVVIGRDSKFVVCLIRGSQVWFLATAV